METDALVGSEVAPSLQLVALVALHVSFDDFPAATVLGEAPNVIAGAL